MFHHSSFSQLILSLSSLAHYFCMSFVTWKHRISSVVERMSTLYTLLTNDRNTITMRMKLLLLIVLIVDFLVYLKKKLIQTRYKFRKTAKERYWNNFSVLEVYSVFVTILSALSVWLTVVLYILKITPQMNIISKINCSGNNKTLTNGWKFGKYNVSPIIFMFRNHNKYHN